MNSMVLKYAAAIAGALALSGGVSAYGQMFPERRFIRSGVGDYENQLYAESEQRFRKALEKNPASWEAAFDLGDALYRQERFDEAAEVFAALADNPDQSREQLAKTFYNLGNTQFALYDPMNQEEGKKMLQEAEQSYMKSLMENPDDMEAKFNLAYVQKMLEEQQDQSDGNGDGGGGGDGQNKGDGEGQGQNDQEGDNEDRNNDSGEGDQEQQEQPRQSNISREDAEAMLNAIQNQENQTREKVNEQQAKAVKASGRNW